MGPGNSGNFLSQWLTCKLLRITYLVGKMKFKLLFQGPLAELGYAVVHVFNSAWHSYT